jgi:hypothetical protein
MANRELEPREREMIARYRSLLQTVEAELNELLMAPVMQIPSFASALGALSPSDLEAQRARSRVLQRGAFVDGDWAPYLSDLKQQGASYARMGVELDDWFRLVTAYRDILLPRLPR